MTDWHWQPHRLWVGDIIVGYLQGLGVYRLQEAPGKRKFGHDDRLIFNGSLLEKICTDDCV
jgi:hypothetical protein